MDRCLGVVLTPFHYPLALLINKVSRNRLKLDYVVLAAFLPDIEIPILFMIQQYPPRLVLHSIIGSILFSFPAILLLWPLYRFIILKIFGIELTIDNLQNLLIASIIGSLSHVFLDALHHNYNPLMWPLSSESVDVFVLFNDWVLASMILNIIFVIITLLIFLMIYKENKSVMKTIKVMISSH